MWKFSIFSFFVKVAREEESISFHFSLIDINFWLSYIRNGTITKLKLINEHRWEVLRQIWEATQWRRHLFGFFPHRSSWKLFTFLIASWSSAKQFQISSPFQKRLLEIRNSFPIRKGGNRCDLRMWASEQNQHPSIERPAVYKSNQDVWENLADCSIKRICGRRNGKGLRGVCAGAKLNEVPKSAWVKIMRGIVRDIVFSLSQKEIFSSLPKTTVPYANIHWQKEKFFGKQSKTRLQWSSAMQTIRLRKVCWRS